MKKYLFLLSSLLILLTSFSALAAPLRVFVGDMNVVGVQNRDELKSTLQTLLASRLNSDRVMAVGSAAEADAVVTGTYVTIGKIFSLDALARTVSGKTLTRAFVQGESQDELIPAIGKLADKLSAEFSKIAPTEQSASAATPLTFPAPAVATPQTSSPAKSDIIKKEPVHPTPAAEFIRPREYEPSSASGWLSKRLVGAANLMAIGKELSGGGREIFLAEAHRLSFFRQGKDMKLVAEAEFKSSEKIISLDTIEQSDGTLDIYVTVIRSSEPASQVWQVKGDKLVKVAENLPYYFRSLNLAGGAKKLYAQSMGRDADFYGDVAEARRNGSTITLTNRIKMPRYGDIYSFNQFRDGEGRVFTLLINPDGYLVVFDEEQKELWRSNDKFGGSELFFQMDDTANARVSGENFRWVFMNQRIQVTSKGDVLVGKNDGFWVLGNARSYKKGAVYCLSWNGSSLEEKWRTRDTQNYMPDYAYDETRNELLILQTVQRPGVSSRGATSLSIKKVE